MSSTEGFRGDPSRATPGAPRKWGGAQSRKARAAWRSQVEAGIPCCRCGKPVLPRPWLPHDGWEPDHYPVPYHQGGTETWPSHSPECNQREGGKDGARITHARRREQQQVNSKNAPRDLRRIRGV